MALILLVLLRLVTLGLSPLYDPSEGRYAEIAREMIESGDWVTPRLNHNEPFWGKPPLHFWMTAASLKVFGYNAFAARLPAFISALLVLALTGLIARRSFGRDAAFWAMLVLLSSGLFFIGSAYVVTDMTLTLCTTGALAAFFMVDQAPGRRKQLWKYGFFIFLGLGMLAKGPVAIVLCALPIGLWTLITRRWDKLRGLPWVSGTLLALAVCAPWYIMAEHRTPGFLNYFFIHEHVLRYLKKDYGDLYSNGHAYPLGTIWGLAAIGLMPWTPFFLWGAWRAVRQKSWKQLPHLGNEAFLLCWALAPMLFFSISRNVIVTYALPAWPALAVLGGKLIQGLTLPEQASSVPARTHRQRLSLLMTFFCGMILLVALWSIYYAESKYDLPLYEVAIGVALAGAGITGLALLHRRRARTYQALCVASLIPCFAVYFSVFVSDEVGQDRSARDLVTLIKQDPRFASHKITFFSAVPYSAEFYLGDQVGSMSKDKAQLRKPLGNQEILIIKGRDLRKVAPESIRHLRQVMAYGPYEFYVATDFR